MKVKLEKFKQFLLFKYCLKMQNINNPKISVMLVFATVKMKIVTGTY